MKKVRIYPNIDMHRTGIRLKKLIANRGYSVTDIQEYLHLSCPQPVYRWFHGRILPSVDHLLMLSELLGVHMEELLVKKQGALSVGDTIYITTDYVEGTASNSQEYLLEWFEWMRQDEKYQPMKCRLTQRLEAYCRKLKDMAA